MNDRRTEGDSITGRRDISEEEIEQRFREEWEQYKKERNDRLHRFFRKVIVMFALLGFTVAGSVVYVYMNAIRNKNALCAIRHDSERRVTLGDEFLKEHPNGIPGISVDSLRRSTNNARQTVESLSSLNCSPAEKTISATPEESPIP